VEERKFVTYKDNMSHHLCLHLCSLVKLVKNFRSHPEILKFPNEQFYRGDLRSCGRTDIINSFAQWRELPTAGFPIIFHDVSGKDEREATSPSYFNIDEIIQVKEYVKLLLNLEQSGIPISELLIPLLWQRLSADGRL
jgi:helicase MOV-10